MVPVVVVVESDVGVPKDVESLTIFLIEGLSSVNAVDEEGLAANDVAVAEAMKQLIAWWRR